MKFVHLLFVLVFAVVGWTESSAQQDPSYVQYWAAQQFYNPAYTGSKYDLEFTAIARRPWIELSNAPFYGVASLGMTSSKLKGAVGGSVWYTGIGSEQDVGGNVAYAFHKELGTGFLNVGASLGFINKRVALNLGSGNVGANGVNQTVLDGSIGAYYHNPSFFLGYSITHPHQPVHSDLGTNFIWYRQHHIMAGWVISKDELKVKPGVGYHLIYDGQFANGVLADVLDLNLQFEYMDRFWAGVLYRKNATYGLNAGIKFDRINIGYAFDRTNVAVGFLPLTSHEFFLTYYLRKPDVE
jgi:type IX secretion system PorP/SprF family membrane protein